MSAEIWQATELESVSTEGRTRPLVLWCEQEGAEGKTERKRFLVKSPGHPEVLESNLFAELFGNLLARVFGIETPQPALIVLNDSFIRSAQPLLPSVIQLRVGYGVGCEYLSPLVPIVSGWRLPPTLRIPASTLYAFDLLATNPDRRIVKPNCALYNGQILAFDFENSFSFLRALSGPKPWMVSGLLVPIKGQDKPFFQKELKAGGADWMPFMETLEHLDAPRLTALAKDFPTPWLSNQQRVLDYLFEVQSQPKKLLLELERSLHV